MRIKTLILFYNQLATLLGSGVDIIRALSVIKNQTYNRRLKEVINGLEEDISRGSTLSGAMSRYKDVFGDLYISIVKAGEISGRLSENMKTIASFLESIHKTRVRLINGFLYPVILISCGNISPIHRHADNEWDFTLFKGDIRSIAPHISLYHCCMVGVEETFQDGHRKKGDG